MSTKTNRDIVLKALAGVEDEARDDHGRWTAGGGGAGAGGSGAEAGGEHKPFHEMSGEELATYWNGAREKLETELGPLKDKARDLKNQVAALDEKWKGVMYAARIDPVYVAAEKQYMDDKGGSVSRPRLPSKYGDAEYNRVCAEQNDADGVLRNRRAELDSAMAESLKLPSERRAKFVINVRADDPAKAKSLGKKLQGFADELGQFVDHKGYTADGWAVGDVHHMDVTYYKGVRASHTPGYSNGSITMGSGDAGTFFHEMGHALEKGVGNKAAAVSFRNSVVDKDAGVKKLYGGRSDEVAYQKKAGAGKIADYALKKYASGSTEILSTGLERFMRSPSGLLRDNPAHFAVLVDALHGRNRKDNT